jgi:hypothetical protein
MEDTRLAHTARVDVSLAELALDQRRTVLRTPCNASWYRALCKHNSVMSSPGTGSVSLVRNLAPWLFSP